MKIRLLVALVGLAISFALPTFAQQKDAAYSPKVQQRDLLGIAKAIGEFADLHRKLDEAYDKNDAAAVAALFTDDGLFVAPDGMFSGRREMETRHAERSSCRLSPTLTAAASATTSSQDLLYGYEVAIVQLVKERDVFGSHYSEHEALPSNEAWGTYGWSFQASDPAYGIQGGHFNGSGRKTLTDLQAWARAEHGRPALLARKLGCLQATVEPLDHPPAHTNASRRFRDPGVLERGNPRKEKKEVLPEKRPGRCEPAA
jgi:hypothetical protein